MNNSYHDVTSKIEKMRELGVEPDNSVIEALREINTPHYICQEATPDKCPSRCLNLEDNLFF